MPLTLEIITPEARVYSDTIDTVVIPTVMGEVGILPGHMPLLTQVADGELRVTKDGKEQHLIVSGGFAQVEGDTVSILAENAITAEKIDTRAAEEAMKRAEEALKNPGKLDPAEKDHYENLVRFAVAQLNIKRPRH
ncbi:ATP synthase, F1 epsilon subunit [Opitutaceae bacterium TAV1]|nr:ATP synthase F1 subunit epsilon [Opitutaceae bacterium TAV5]EIP98462.1 ATP synthase, F1 epsilon subunit [Opitutaceae bacterium TAV1]